MRKGGSVLHADPEQLDVQVLVDGVQRAGERDVVLRGEDRNQKARKNQMKYIEAVFLWFFLPYYGWRVVIKNKGDELIEILHTHMKLAEIVYESIPQAGLQIIILRYEGLDDNDVWYSAFRVFSVVISVLSVFYGFWKLIFSGHVQKYVS